MAALFVKDLHPEVSEVILSNRFRPAGHVQSVHICRDRKTGSPLGYAYVNFRYRDDAERAIDMFNFELLLGRPMRVMWSNWEPTAKPIKGGNIFIRNLDWSIDCTSLFDTFSVFGRIVSCKVVESKGYGYVQYESAEAAERLNGKLLNDRKVTIEHFKSFNHRRQAGRQTEKQLDRQVHRQADRKTDRQTDLHPEVSEVILSNRFRPAGHVQSVHICRDRKTGSPLRYAYVNFRYRDDAERAIDMFSFEILLGRPMRVMWSNWEPTAKPIKGGNIFIRNLDWSIDCTSLFDTFSVFGRIVSCKVVESKGYGYVQYESAEAAERLNGKLLNDRQVTIEHFKSFNHRRQTERKTAKKEDRQTDRQ
ncbi:hypothetical protein KOW79_000044, partial [Hemibagrus wyckioides]